MREQDLVRQPAKTVCTECGASDGHLMTCPNHPLANRATSKGYPDGVADRDNQADPRASTAVNTEQPRPSILDEAKRIIYGDREKTYGSPDKNLTHIALLWSEYLDSKFNVAHPLDVNDVCLMMILLKVARLANDPSHHDSMVDLAGYAALMERVQNHVKNSKP